MAVLNSHSGILYSSYDKSILVVDIPLSIATSQNSGISLPVLRHVISVTAPVEPWPSTEPRSEKGKLNLLARIDSATRERNAWCTEFVREKLDVLRKEYQGPWCLERCVQESEQSDPTEYRKRKADDEIPRDSRHGNNTTVAKWALLLLEKQEATRITAEGITNRFIHNTSSSTKDLTIISHDGQQTILLPPNSIFHRSTINHHTASQFHSQLLALYSEPTLTAAPGQFNIILLDPPWSNHSVSRANKYTTFNTRSPEDDALSAVSSILPSILAPDGLVAVWITNKKSSRDRALALMESAGVTLVEEWIWLKVTTDGRPMYALDGLYRQPWEVCLIGRAGQITNGGGEDDEDVPVKRKLIIACPELHSRKPWIGGMLVDMYAAAAGQHGEVRKLEVFARCTAAGWCTWGDEPTLFNEDRCWRDVVQHEEQEEA